jgi:hypothetical protein
VRFFMISGYSGAMVESNLKFKDIVLGQYKGPENYKICLRTLCLRRQGGPEGGPEVIDHQNRFYDVF